MGKLSFNPAAKKKSRPAVKLPTKPHLSAVQKDEKPEVITKIITENKLVYIENKKAERNLKIALAASILILIISHLVR